MNCGRAVSLIFTVHCHTQNHTCSALRKPLIETILFAGVGKKHTINTCFETRSRAELPETN